MFMTWIETRNKQIIQVLFLFEWGGDDFAQDFNF